MIPRLTWVLFFLAFCKRSSLALVFTNSFNGWIGNSSYRLTWDSSANDPELYDLAIAHPVGTFTPGQEVNVNTPVDYSYKCAIQIPKNGDHFLQVTLPPQLLPGNYVMLIEGVNNAVLTTAFAIGFNPSANTAGATTAAATTYVQVTATESAIVTQNGHTVAVKPSDVFSSAIVYTTVIVISGSGNGTPGKIPMIVGLVLGLGTLMTVPIVVWLVLRYRRRPKGPNDATWDKQTPYEIKHTNSIKIELLERGETTNADGTRQVYSIIDGEKRPMSISQNPGQPSTDDLDPFADPFRANIPSRPQQLSRLSIPDTTLHVVNASSATLPNQSASDTPSHSPSNTAPSLGRSYIDEKSSHGRSQRSSPSTTRMLTPEEVSSRMFIPGRAVDMGPLGRTRAGDVDEDGLLPPDYSQATQPLPPQAEPSRHA
ncbi:hypothetical protein RhiJN_09996 [Ceratobasidium sp. AG-Ba]|nr:hypothetical protein RhiJN_09996 [Ceratobasidium sp. AG-Ba]QRW10762.1 hypothetical protein RhiLY_09761 [Ceratobasidium sp. AG-Ba]